MIPAHLEPKGLAPDEKPLFDVRHTLFTRDAAERGSRRLRDAIWKLQGYKPPKRKAAHRVGLCSKCFSPVGPKRHLVAEIQQTVAAYYGIAPEQMTSANRRRDIAHARQQAMYLASELTKHSIAEIGRRFNRDHTTILHAINVVRARCERDEEEAFNVTVLRERLTA